MRLVCGARALAGLLLAAFFSASCERGGDDGDVDVFDGAADGDADGDTQDIDPEDGPWEWEADPDAFDAYPEYEPDVPFEGCPYDGGGEPGCADDCAASGLVCNERWGICVVADCMGRPDFTPCKVITEPDRSWDLCVEGFCVSPGCDDRSCVLPGPHFPMPDTNQRLCVAGDGEIACSGTAGTEECAGLAFCGQDAEYGWDTHYPAEERFARTATVADEPIVVDTVTGLQWQGCIAGRRGSDCWTGSTAHATWADAVACCDALSWGGFDDWGLPDAWELRSLTNFGLPWMAGPDVAFPGVPDDAYSFWTSSMRRVISRDHTSVSPPWSDTAAFRCVRRPPPAPAGPRAVRSEPVPGEPVVTVGPTGLAWQGCVLGRSGSACTAGTVTTMTWPEALAACEALDWGGRTDWRLPDANELLGIVDLRYESPAIDSSLFPAAPLDDHWTSTPATGSYAPGRIETLQFGNEIGGRATVPGYPAAVRCVRGGSGAKGGSR